MLEIILVILSCVIMTLYVILHVLQWGFPSSISFTYYRSYQNVARWLFPAVLFTCGALAITPLLNHTPENYQFLAFFIVAAILFIAASPAYKDELVGKVHTGAALVLCAATIAWLILTNGIPWIAVGGAIIGLLRRKEFVFWLEVGLLANLYKELFVLLF